MVFFGMDGGDPDLVDPRMLMDTTKTLTGGGLWNYLIWKEGRIKRASQLFQWISNKDLTIPQPTIFKLSDGRQAHAFPESRQSTGKIIFVP